MKSYWRLANFISLGNLLCGTFSIFCSVNHEFQPALFLILLGVVFDFLDGKIARHLGQASNFGKGLDSLSDCVTFGIAPATMGAVLVNGLLWPGFVLALFVSAGAWRLAYFMQWSEKGRPPGMPITMNGLFFPLLFLFHVQMNLIFVFFLVSTGLMVVPILRYGPEVS